MTVIRVRDVVSGHEHVLRPMRLIIAGFTGREQASVQAHMGELLELGVQVPAKIPVFFELDPALLTTATHIDVVGAFTSGEVEPVIAVHDGKRLLTVGSDHTDRNLERSSIAESKQACPKVIADRVLPMACIRELDNLELASWCNGNSLPYQEGRLAQLLPLETIIAQLKHEGFELRDGDVLFLGTVPIRDGELRPSTTFRARLHDPRTGVSVEMEYGIGVRSKEAR